MGWTEHENFTRQPQKVILIFITAVTSTELVPERFLRPRNFNHHPFTDVGGPPTPKPLAVLTQSNPYAVLSQKKPREGREFARQDVIFYPSPHPSVLPAKKYLETNEIGNYDDPYVNIPKNYAFSYIVKDHQSGDDFSHSQAHNGKATRGQYRVKLPDGRVQIVSYTADHKGYRADVQYEDDLSTKQVDKILQYVKPTILPVTPSAVPSPRTPKPVKNYPTQVVAQLPQYHFIPTYNTEPSNHLTDPNAALGKDYLKIVLAHTPKPAGVARYYDYVSSTTPTPYPNGNGIVSSSSQQREPYNQQILAATPTPYVHDPYSGSHSYKVIASSAPDHVLVTPRTLLNPIPIPKGSHEGKHHLIYKYF